MEGGRTGRRLAIVASTSLTTVAWTDGIISEKCRAVDREIERCCSGRK